MDEKIELKLKDYLFNAGLLGFINILGEETKNNGELEIDNKNRLIRFSPKVLENFEYKYFDFFIKRYGKTLTYGKILEFEKYIDEFEENGEKIKSINELKMINDKITFFKAKIKSESYKKAYDFIEKNGTNKILEMEKELKKIKEPKENAVYIRSFDKSMLPNQMLKQEFYEAAQKKGYIPEGHVQLEATDGSFIHKSLEGTPAVVLVLPLKHKQALLNSLKVKHINNLSDVIIEFIKGLTAEKIEKFGFKG